MAAQDNRFCTYCGATLFNPAACTYCGAPVVPVRRPNVATRAWRWLTTSTVAIALIVAVVRVAKNCDAQQDATYAPLPAIEQPAARSS